MRKVTPMLTLCFCIVLSSSVVCIAASENAEMATEERNKATVGRFVEEFWNKLDLAVLDEIAAPNFSHQLNAESRSLEAYEELYADSPAAYSQSHFVVQDMIAEGEKVVIYWTWSGTVAQTGKEIADFPGITIFYFADGKLEKILSCHDMTPFH